MAFGNHILTAKSYSYMRRKIPKISCLIEHTYNWSKREGGCNWSNTNTLTIVDNSTIPIKLTANGAPNAVETPDNNVFKESVSDR